MVMVRTSVRCMLVTLQERSSNLKLVNLGFAVTGVTVTFCYPRHLSCRDKMAFVAYQPAILEDATRYPIRMDKESTSRARQNAMLTRITVAIPTATPTGAGSACGCTRAGFALSPARRGVLLGAAPPRSARSAIAGCCDVIRFFLHDRFCCGIRPGAIDEYEITSASCLYDAEKLAHVSPRITTSATLHGHFTWL
jgi:hypothetical protein